MAREQPTESEKSDTMPMRNLNALQADLGDTATILCPGPKGCPYWDAATGTVIAVNRAVQIPIHKDWWIVADGCAVGLDWFEQGCETYKGNTAFSTGVHKLSDYRADYEFEIWPHVEWDYAWDRPRTYIYRPSHFRMMEGVAGIAAEFACRCGVKNVNFIGLDLFDNLYARYVQTFPMMFMHWGLRGVKFRLLSPSKLYWEPERNPW